MDMAKMSDEQQSQYGEDDASFQAASVREGLQKLVDDFYDLMEQRPEAKEIRDIHPPDLIESRDKLSRFLCGWLGGPKLYREKYGPLRLPSAHAHLNIGNRQRDAWLSCIKKALVKQPYAESFKKYLIEQLYVPAERSRTRD